MRDAQASCARAGETVNCALQAVCNLCSSAPVCPRMPKDSGFAPGAMVILAGLSVPFVALQFSVDVQLFAASAGGLLGMLAVRKRCSPQDEANDAWMPGRTIFRYDANRLAIVGNAMLQKTRKKKQPLSIVVLDFSDLPELQFVCKGEARD